MKNDPRQIEIVKLDAPLGAEVRGVDFAHPLGAQVQDILRKAWSDHLILLFRGQAHIEQQDHINATRVFGAPVAGAALKYFEASGTKEVNQAKFKEISVVSNLDAQGNPVQENDGLGSGEVVWHSDNSYIDEPPIGSFLMAREIPSDGGHTSWNNQYLAFETLPDDVKVRMKGLVTKQDSSRNSAGRLRPGVATPMTLDDVPGPNHPLVRIVPETGRPALYLGRRRVFPSQYVIGWSREQSEELLDFLWGHATDSKLQYTHEWELGDMVLWDNRCTMHYREPLTTLQRRVMHRTQIQNEAIVAA
ncbi:MAG: taurine dioxygenase [Gammaproteobacteria bacterium]|jgi:taurine dioxygenase